MYDGGEQLVTGWHFHDVHEIEYACRGMVEVKTEAGHYLLPPHQAAWIPAGLHHQTTLNAGVQTLAVLFEPRLVPVAGDRVRIIAVSALRRIFNSHLGMSWRSYLLRARVLRSMALLC
jgi:mannose-6-phosphate isomerase-like protein (cupin superfamily)